MADEYPVDLLYHPDHQWARVEEDRARFGITWFAQQALGEATFFGPPRRDDVVQADHSYGLVESLKATSDVVAPMSGRVTSVNAGLGPRPELLNDDPYGEGWTIEIELSDPSEPGQLLSAAEYEALIRSL